MRLLRLVLQIYRCVPDYGELFGHEPDFGLQFPGARVAKAVFGLFCKDLLDDFGVLGIRHVLNLTFLRACISRILIG